MSLGVLMHVLKDANAHDLGQLSKGSRGLSLTHDLATGAQIMLQRRGRSWPWSPPGQLGSIKDDPFHGSYTLL